MNAPFRTAQAAARDSFAAYLCDDDTIEAVKPVVLLAVALLAIALLVAAADKLTGKAGIILPTALLAFC